MTTPAARLFIATALVVSTAAAARAQAVRPVLTAKPSVAADRPTRDRDVARTSALFSSIAPSVSARRTVTTTASIVGGAALGAWLGYFLSQVVKSDWEGERTGERAGHRRTFALSGAAVGALSGYLIRPRDRRRRAEPSPLYVYVAPSARHYITRQELRRTVALSALEAVQMLRPEWLGTTSMGSSTTANAIGVGGGESGIAVFVVDTRVGGAEMLADITITEIEELRLYEPRETVRRWGISLPMGAIEVVPVAVPSAK